MVKDIKQLLENRLFSNKDEQIILSVINPYFKEMKNKHIRLHNGVLSFNNIPSAIRLNILMKKDHLIQEINNRGVYLRDIL